MYFLIIDINKRIGTKTVPQYVVQRLSDELKKRNIPCDVCGYQDIVCSLEGGTYHIHARGKPLETYTHIIMRGHRTPYEYMLKQYIVDYAKHHGITVQNAAFIKKWPHYNKLLQMAFFSSARLPYPDSAYCIDGRYWEKKELLNRIGFPLIYKHIEGEYKVEIIDGKEKLKKNVYLVKDLTELEKVSNTYDHIEAEFIDRPSRFFIQKFLTAGSDYRAIMIGGTYVGGWKRTAGSNFITVSKGSEYTLCDHPEPSLKELAERTATLLEADYCAIDIMYEGEKPYILEVNMNPGFKAFETKVAGADIDMSSLIINNLSR